MKQSLAGLYDKLERLIQKYEPSHSNDELYGVLIGIVHVVDAPNDAASNGGKGYYCKAVSGTASGRATRPSRRSAPSPPATAWCAARARTPRSAVP